MLYQAMQEQYGLLFWMNELFPILSESYLSWDADLVAVEVVGLLASFTFFVDPVVYLCQRFVDVGIGVDIGISAVRSGFLQYMAVAPNEASMVFEVD